MKAVFPIVLAALAVSSAAFAQAPQLTNDQIIARAVLAAPQNMQAGATVVKWKPDFTYETLRQGTNKIFCFDRSGEPGQAAFAVQCTSLGNLARVAQNRKIESEPDTAKRRLLVESMEKDGTRVKPEFGSFFKSMNGPDQEHARIHTTIAVPGATKESMGLPDNPTAGGAWIMNAGTTTAHIMSPGN